MLSLSAPPLPLSLSFSLSSPFDCFLIVTRVLLLPLSLHVEPCNGHLAPLVATLPNTVAQLVHSTALTPMPTWAAGLGRSRQPVDTVPVELATPSPFDDELYPESGYEPNQDDEAVLDQIGFTLGSASSELPVRRVTEVQRDPAFDLLLDAHGGSREISGVARYDAVLDLLRLIQRIGNDASHPDIQWLLEFQEPEAFQTLLSIESLDPVHFRAGGPRDAAEGWRGIQSFLQEVGKTDRFAGLPTRPIAKVLRMVTEGIAAPWAPLSRQKQPVLKRGLALLRSAKLPEEDIQGMLRSQQTRPSALHLPNHRSATAIDPTFLPQQLGHLLARGIIRPAEPIVTVPVALVRQPSKDREIMDARFSNLYICPPRFHYEGLHSFLLQLKQGDFVSVCDMKAGYNHFIIVDADQPYFGLSWAGETFVYNTLCFGRNAACYEFTSIMTEVFRPLRVAGWRLGAYIDDHAKASASLTLALFQQWAIHRYFKLLGLTFSAKGNRFPSTRFKYLGFEVDTSNMSIRLPEDKLQRVLASCRLLLDKLAVGVEVTRTELA